MSLILMTGGQSPLGRSLQKLLGSDSPGMNHEVVALTAKAYAKEEAEWRGAKGVIHLGGCPNVEVAERWPITAVNDEVADTLGVVRKAGQVGHWLLYASSCEVYGAASELPVNEQAPLLPANLFGRMKVLCEDLVRATSRDLKTAILRLGSVFGDLDDVGDWDRHVGKFARAAVGVSSGKVSVMGPGVVRDYVSADSAAVAFAKAVAALEAGDGLLPTLNVASGAGTSNGELANFAALLCRTLGAGSLSFDLGERQSFEVPRFVADVTRAKHHLGWDGSANFAKSFGWFCADLAASKRKKEHDDEVTTKELGD